MKFNELGRSMVEMLGVLAIVGVLSVGAISGYSKAMMKYKLNKQAEALNMLFFNIFQTIKSLENTTTGSQTQLYSDILAKLNLLPDGIQLHPTQEGFLQDVFANRLWVFARPSDYGIGYDIKSSNNEICYNIFSVFKQYDDLLLYVATDGYAGHQITFYGRKYCSQYLNCLKDLTISNINELCKGCSNDEQYCRFYITWK